MARIIQPQSVYNRSVDVKQARPKSMYDYNPFEELITPQGAMAAVDIVGKVGGTVADAVDHHSRTRAAEARADEVVKKSKARAEAKALQEQMKSLGAQGRLTPEMARQMQSKISGFEKKEELERAGAMAEQSYATGMSRLAGAKDYAGQQSALADMSAAYDRPGSGSLWNRFSGGAEDTITKQFERVRPPLYADPQSKLDARGGAGSGKANRRVGEGYEQRKGQIDNSQGVQDILKAGRLATGLDSDPGLMGALPAALKGADKSNGLYSRSIAEDLVRAGNGQLEMGAEVPVGAKGNPFSAPMFTLRTPLTARQRQESVTAEGETIQGALESFHRDNSEKARRLIELAMSPRIKSAFETVRIGEAAHNSLWDQERFGAYGDDFSRNLQGWNVLRNLTPFSAEQILNARNQSELMQPGHSGHGPRVNLELTKGDRPSMEQLQKLKDERMQGQAASELDKLKAAEAAGFKTPPSLSGARPQMFIDRETGQATTQDPRRPSAYREGGSSFDDIIKRNLPENLRQQPSSGLVSYDIGGGRTLQLTAKQAAELDTDMAEPMTKEDETFVDQQAKAMGINAATGESMPNINEDIPSSSRKYRSRARGRTKKQTKELRKTLGQYPKYSPQSIVTGLNQPSTEQVLKIREKAMQVATQQGVEPALFDALIRRESGYHPLAVSPNNAIGLTQVTPPAFHDLGGSAEEFANLFDEDMSLEAGAMYLKWVENTLRKSGFIKKNDPRKIQKILAGYNAGVGETQRLGIVGVLSPTREANGRIGETHKYVKEIMIMMAKAKRNAVAERR